MMVLIKLLLAHFLGDFVLQPSSWVKQRQRQKWRSPKFYLHLLTHGLILMVILWDWYYWSLSLILVGMHGVIDLLKVYAERKETEKRWFLIDQLLHMVSILFLWMIWQGVSISGRDVLTGEHWLYLLAFVIVTRVSDVVLQKVLSQWAPELADGEEESLHRAGQYIGVLERLFVCAFVVLGNFQAIGFLIAAKSVFRFGDLRKARDRKLTEYILIGTLLSFGLAMGTGLFLRLMTQLT